MSDQTDPFRMIALVAKAAAECDIELSRALRFMAALTLIMTAEAKPAPPETETKQ